MILIMIINVIIFITDMITNTIFVAVTETIMNTTIIIIIIIIGIANIVIFVPDIIKFSNALRL